MPDVEWNKTYWNDTHPWPESGDEWSAGWDLTGPVEDDETLHLVGGKLANDDAWPGWYAGSEFKALRDQTMARRR